MNAQINLKLEGLRHRLEEATSSAYFSFILDADVKFLESVAKILKTKLGTKLSHIAVKRGNAAAWLEGEGEDLADLTVDFTVSLNLKSYQDVDVNLGGNSVSRGKFDRDIAYKTGVLTPALVADAVAEQFK